MPRWTKLKNSFLRGVLMNFHSWDYFRFYWFKILFLEIWPFAGSCLLQRSKGYYWRCYIRVNSHRNFL